MWWWEWECHHGGQAQDFSLRHVWMISFPWQPNGNFGRLNVRAHTIYISYYQPCVKGRVTCKYHLLHLCIVMYKSPPFDLVTAPAHFIRPQRACGEDMRTPVEPRDRCYCNRSAYAEVGTCWLRGICAWPIGWWSWSVPFLQLTHAPPFSL